MMVRVLKNRVKLPPLSGAYKISTPASHLPVLHKHPSNKNKSTSSSHQNLVLPSIPVDSTSRVRSLKVSETGGPEDISFLKREFGYVMPNEAEVVQGDRMDVFVKANTLRREANGIPQKPKTESSARRTRKPPASKSSTKHLDTTISAEAPSRRMTKQERMSRVKENKRRITETLRQQRLARTAKSRVEICKAEFRRQGIIQERRDHLFNEGQIRTKRTFARLTGEMDTAKEAQMQKDLYRMRQEMTEKTLSNIRKINQWKHEYILRKGGESVEDGNSEDDGDEEDNTNEEYDDRFTDYSGSGIDIMDLSTISPYVGKPSGYMDRLTASLGTLKLSRQSSFTSVVESDSTILLSHIPEHWGRKDTKMYYSEQRHKS